MIRKDTQKKLFASRHPGQSKKGEICDEKEVNLLFFLVSVALEESFTELRTAR